MSKTNYVGVGLYTYPEAAQIIGVDTRRLRRWVTEYYYTSGQSRYHHEPVIARRFSPEERVLTFLELVELLFVKMFRAHGVSMSTIRRASRRAAQIFRTDYPFAVRRFDTDGSHIFATLKREADSPELIEDLSRGQLAFESVVRPFFRTLEYRDNESALAFWPMERSGRVVLDPERSFGKPIDAETGVPTSVLYDAVHAGAGQSVEGVAKWYEVPVQAVEAAIAYECSLRAA